MRSDIIHVTNGGEGSKTALSQAELVAAYKGLSRKDTLHLRLLTEEMLGMMQALTGEQEGDFWIEDEDDSCNLHLRVKAAMNTEMRENLLKASTSGENAAVRGVMGKIRDIFERLIEPVEGGLPDEYKGGITYTGADLGNVSTAAAGVWSFKRYKDSVKEGNAPQEQWDELEKSVVAKLADEVKIGIADKTVEMIIYKKF